MVESSGSSHLGCLPLVATARLNQDRSDQGQGTDEHQDFGPRPPAVGGRGSQVETGLDLFGAAAGRDHLARRGRSGLTASRHIEGPASSAPSVGSVHSKVRAGWARGL